LAVSGELCSPCTSPAKLRVKLALDFAAESPTRGHPVFKSVALAGESTFKPKSAIHLPLWRAAVWQLPHLRVGGRLSTTTTQSETFSESLPDTPTFPSWVVGQQTAPTSAYMCVALGSTGNQADALAAVAHQCLGTWAPCCQGPVFRISCSPLKPADQTERQIDTWNGTRGVQAQESQASAIEECEPLSGTWEVELARDSKR
jgi:hypothetical protein